MGGRPNPRMPRPPKPLIARALPGRVRDAGLKVPEITVSFWLIKVLSTGMGEATSDYLVHTIAPVLAVALGAVVLACALGLQFSAPRYVPWVYWFAVVMVAVFGTMVADGLHVQLGVPYVVSTIAFTLALAVVFWAWYRTERTLSIHSITTPRREFFYWATVMATFALGTAAGDLTAHTVGLGYLGAGVLFTALIAVPALAYWALGLNAIVAFWFAYIVTRPLGASYADWLGVPHSLSGLGLGRGTVSLALTAAIVVCVGYLTLASPERAARGEPAPPPHPEAMAEEA